MASHDQSYQASEVKGRTEVFTRRRTERWGPLRDKAEAAKDKTYETAQAAKDKTMESKGPVRSYVYHKAGAAKQKASETAEATKEKAWRAAEQVKSMAQGDKETVKQTFRMGGDDRIDRDDPTLYRDDLPRYT